VSTVEKIAGLIVGVALVTTLILPDRQTVPVLSTAFNGFSTALKTAMGRA
jgi:hypothetical protein